MKKLLIVISACNEAASLDVFLPRLRKICDSLPIENQILLISDGSEDETVAVARKNSCKVIVNKRNLGIGCSLRKGYKYAIKNDFDFVATLDADGQHDENLLPGIVNVLLEGSADFVVASRYHKDSERFGVPLDRDMLNVSVSAQMRVLTGWTLTDPLSGFWGVKKDLFNFILNGKQERYGFHLENLINLWYLPVSRLKHLEIAHPAIYKNHGTKQLLTRQYSMSNKEQRVERFGTHANQLLESIDRIRDLIGEEVVDEEIFNRRNFSFII